MSLSEAPSAKITYSTPQDISDEILGGAISLCKETGYKANITMLTFFWSALLFSARGDVEDNKLTAAVVRRYPQSLSAVFPFLRGNKEKQDDVYELCRKYYDQMSSDFSSFSTDAERAVLFQIADKLNDQNDSAAAYQVKPNPQKTFSQISGALCSSIYGILYQIDNGMTIQYRHILYPISSPINQPLKPIHTSVQPAVQQTKKKMSVRAITLIVLAIVLATVVIVSLYNKSNPGLEPVAEPQSGTILAGNTSSYGQHITVKAPHNNACVVKLKTKSGTIRLMFYVRAGEEVTLGVPCEKLYVSFASGDTWYGEEHLFGKGTSYQVDETACDFTRTSWVYTIRPSSDGNLNLKTVSKDKW